MKQAICVSINTPKIELDQHTVVQSLLALDTNVVAFVQNQDCLDVFTNMYSGVIVSGQLEIMIKQGANIDQLLDQAGYSFGDNQVLAKECADAIKDYSESNCVLTATLITKGSEQITPELKLDVPVIEKEITAFDAVTPTVNSKSLQFSKILDSVHTVLSEKNKRYGNAALDPLKVFAGKTKVGNRLDDKLARIKNSPELRKNDVFDTLGYLVLVCAENGWDDFSDQLD